MGHAWSTSGGLCRAYLFSYNGIGALCGHNLVSLYHLSSNYIEQNLVYQ